ncbi:MAG: hypothetical protein LBF13_04215 [Campylobacteraceae bacterium]|jgi:hypothetical protein|nr:hypothetical protein [Campylobacteraceae bacterium]
MSLESVIKEWAETKERRVFDYQKQLQRKTSDTPYCGEKYSEINHLNYTQDQIKTAFENTKHNFTDYEVDNILDLINRYAYYLKMNELLDTIRDNEKNIKSLNIIAEHFNNDFVDFLNNFLDLDKEVRTDTNTYLKYLKIDGNAKDVMAHYLRCHFTYQLQNLREYFQGKKKRKDGITVTTDDLTLNLFIRPKVKILQKRNPRLILKCLHYELLANCPTITKQISLNLIYDFFSILLSESKIEHSFSREAINLIKTDENHFFTVDEYYKPEFDDKKQPIDDVKIPSHIEELKDIFIALKWIRENLDFRVVV